MGEGFSPMPVPAMGTALVPSGAEVDGEHRRVVFGGAFRAAPATKERPARTKFAEGEIGEQCETGHEEEHKPDLIDDRPEYFAETACIPRHEQDRKVE